MKNIIVTGNGFDISLDLKTKYEHFIEFSNDLTSKVIEKSQEIAHSSTNPWDIEKPEGYIDIIKTTFGLMNNPKTRYYNKNLFGMRDNFLGLFPTYKEFQIISNNIFIKYLNFLKEKTKVYATNWNNIEEAIAEIAETMSFLINNLHESYVREFLYEDSYSHLQLFKSQKSYLVYNFLVKEGLVPLEGSDDVSDLQPLLSLNERFLNELHYLTLLLEFYFNYVDKQISQDKLTRTEFLDFIASIGNKAFLNFNYTHSLETILDVDTDIHHVHGEVRSSLFGSATNLIFGTRDYTEEVGHDYTIGYQKFYQRVLKSTGSKYESFFENVNSDRMNVIVFGHSVSPLDREIFEDMFELSDVDRNETVKFIFMYYDDSQRQAIIKNLAFIIGKKRLIKLSGNDRILFCKSDDIRKLKSYCF